MQSQISSKEIQLHILNLCTFGLTELENLDDKLPLGKCRICDKYTNTKCTESTLFPGETLCICVFCMKNLTEEISNDSTFKLKLREQFASEEVQVHICESCGDNWRWTGLQELSGPLPRRYIECFCGDTTHPTYSRVTNLQYIDNQAPVHVYLRKGENFDGKLEDIMPEMIYVKKALGCDYPDCKNTMPRFAYKGRGWDISFLPNTYARMIRKEYGPIHRLDFCEDHSAEGNLPCGIFLVHSHKDHATASSDHVKKYIHKKRKEIESRN
jgi:hypothetical protein